MTVLWRGGVVFSPADPRATALVTDGDRIVWVGPDAGAPSAERVVDLDGALVAPAFVDAHVHATDTGLAMGGLDLSRTRSPGELLDAVAAFAAVRPPDAVVHGHGWDESTWPDQRPPSADELDRAARGRRVYLSQASAHSALCSRALLAAVPQVVSVDGWVREHDHHAVRAVALGSLSAVQRTAVQRVALAAAAAAGIAAVHECGGPGTSSEADFVGLLALSGAGVPRPESGLSQAGSGLPEVYGYWGELGGAAKARGLGAVGAAGDLYADGALGSRTAHLRSSYVDGDTCGEGFLSAEQVAAHLVDCVSVGVQGGFHAIGDAAIAAVLDGFARAAHVVGVDRVRAGRPRVEHLELADRAMIARLVEFGVVASVQPAFDRLWGGAGRMYAQRLGLARSLASNPFGSMHAVGVTLAFGSDSPVTPLDPWGSVAAAVAHRHRGSRLSVRAAFAAHTRGGWRALSPSVTDPGGMDGMLMPGAPATFAVWETPGGVMNGLPALPAEPDEEFAVPVCRATVLRGSPIFGEV